MSPPLRGRSSILPGQLGLRLLAMLGALLLIGATIYTLRSQYLTSLAAERAAGKKARIAVDPATPWQETIIPGPSDDDPVEREEIREFFQVIDDRTPIHAVDTPAYWKLMKWAMSRPISELEERSRTVKFGELWQHPEKYRGELIRLRLHVLRVDHDDATIVPENSLGLKNLYRVCGGTEDSVDNPYVVVVPEVPPGIDVGTSSRAEAVFVGYFLKIYAYTAFKNQSRGAPVLIGRIRKVGGGDRQVASSRSSGLTAMLVGGAVLISGVVLAVSLFRMTRSRRRVPLSYSSRESHSTIDVESWLERGIVDDPEGAAATAERYSPAIFTNGRAHRENGETAAESNDGTE
jgi:hypothetical protein